MKEKILRVIFGNQDHPELDSMRRVGDLLGISYPHKHTLSDTYVFEEDNKVYKASVHTIVEIIRIENYTNEDR